MAGPLLETKLFVPRLRRAAVARPRLTEELRLGSEAKLTLVSAPAGFGKTTVLAQWLASGAAPERPVAWLSLEEDDSQPGSFWTYLSTALDRAIPGVAADALALLASPQPNVQAVLATIVNELAAEPTDIEVVLDDYHLVDGPGIGAGMTFLLEHLPPNVHLVISTRADPALPLARLRARGELVEIRASDLRFTSQEVASYLNGISGLDLNGQEVAVLDGRTEGWIAALQLAALSMKGREDVRGFIAGFAGDDRYIVDYLVEEVLVRQPQQVRDFLVSTCILDRLNGRLCDAVTGQPGGKAMLQTLERANLFVVPTRRRPPLVPLPPPVRRGPSHLPRRRAPRRGLVPAPPGQPVVRAAGGDPVRRSARAGSGRRQPCGRAGRARHPRSAPHPAGRNHPRLGRGHPR